MKKCLIVEDEVLMQRLIAATLTRLGYSSELVKTGSDALQRAQHADYDLVTFDLVLPDMSGLELLKQFKSISKLTTIPVIIISATDSEETLKQARELGAAAIARKPLTLDSLQSALHSIFGE